MIRSNHLSPRRLIAVASLFFCALATAQPGPLRVLDPAPSSDGTILTDEPALVLKGSLSGVSTESRILWENTRGFSDLASVTVAADGQSLLWQTTASVPLRPGVNQIRIQALGQPGVSTFVNIFYTPREIEPAPRLRRTMLNGQQINYHEMNGRAIFQGDIDLGRTIDVEQGRFAGRFAIDSRRGLHPNAATIAPGLMNRTALWPLASGVRRVPYTTNGVDAANITAAVNQVNSQLTGVLQWVPAVGGDTNKVVFSLTSGDQGGGCVSFIGMIGGSQTITGSENCTVGTLIHEMGHAMGLYHEQSRRDRDNYLTYTEANVDKPNADNFAIYDSGVDSGYYNHASIMHYQANLFARDGLSIVMETLPVGIPLATSLAQYTTGDMDGLLRLYGLAPTAVTVDTNPTGLKVIVDGVQCTAPCVFNSWALGSQHTLNVPLDANSQTLQTLAATNYIFGRWNADTAGTNLQSITITNSAGDGTLLRPGTSPAYTHYVANFVPIYIYNPTSSGATISQNPAPSTMIIGGNSTKYYRNRQLVTITATPNAGQGFLSWTNVSLFNFYANPLVVNMSTSFANAQAFTSASPIITLKGASPDLGPIGAFGSLAGGIVGQNSFFYTPRNFAFANGTNLTLCASPLSGGTCPVSAPAQTPVTYNINYNFTNWTGGPSTDAYTIAVPAGNTTYTANYTGNFRSLIEPNVFCSGQSVTASPAGSSSQGSGGAIDAFLSAGNVTLTATPASGMTFVGWGHDLSGTANPLTVNVQNQLLGDANFNIAGTTAPLTISGVVPSTGVATPNAIDLTITGTGFTTDTNKTTTFLWVPSGNLATRSRNLNSSTQLVMHLDAGDVASPGYYRIRIHNTGTNGSCVPYVTGYFSIGTAGSPALSISKSHTGNFTIGQQGTYSIQVTNSGNASTGGTVTVTDTAPSGLSIVSMSGSNWTCPVGGNTCTRSDSLGSGLSYPAITVTVSVLYTATDAQVTAASLAVGGASSGANTTDSTTIKAQVPNVVNLTQQAAGAALVSAGLVTGTITSAASNTIPSGSVISSNPIAGTVANVGSSVALVISTGPSLSSIAVTPVNPIVGKTLTKQFTATGTYSDASTKDITSTVTWTSATPGVATINATTGIATGVNAGTSNITATLGAVTSPASLLTVVGPPSISSPSAGFLSTLTSVSVTVQGAAASASIRIFDGANLLTTAFANGSGTLTTSVVLTPGAHSLTAQDQTTTLTSPAVTGTVTAGKCDVNSDGGLSYLDVLNMINQALGINAVNNLNGAAGIDVLDIQIAINAAMGQSCTAI